LKGTIGGAANNKADDQEIREGKTKSTIRFSVLRPSKMSRKKENEGRVRDPGILLWTQHWSKGR